MSDYEPIITVLGPTATGKTGVAVRIAAELGGEIVSADSRQVFRRMDIGSGKDLSEYQYHGEPIPYHLIDVEEPGKEYNVYRYQQEAFKAIRDIQERGKRVVLCGGSGLYLDAVLQGYRFKFQEESQILSDPVPSAIIGLRGDRERIRERITRRLQARLQEGMIEEVQALLDEGIPAERLIRFGLEYKYVTLYLTGELHYGDMVSLLNTAIHQFSKRQMTWFRRMERLGFYIRWVDADLPEEEKFQKIYTCLREEGIDCFDILGT